MCALIGSRCECVLCSDWLQVLNLLSISLRLVESWEFPSRSLPVGSRNLISPKLTELKTGIQLLMKVRKLLSNVMSS